MSGLRTQLHAAVSFILSPQQTHIHTCNNLTIVAAAAAATATTATATTTTTATATATTTAYYLLPIHYLLLLLPVVVVVVFVVVVVVVVVLVVVVVVLVVVVVVGSICSNSSSRSLQARPGSLKVPRSLKNLWRLPWSKTVYTCQQTNGVKAPRECTINQQTRILVFIAGHKHWNLYTLTIIRMTFSRVRYYAKAADPAKLLPLNKHHIKNTQPPRIPQRPNIIH